MANTSIWDMSTTAASNTSVQGVSIAENCPPANINDAMRSMIAQTKGAVTSVTASGIDTYTATLAPAPDALTDGMDIRIRFTNANTSTTPTLNINSLGAKTITKNGGSALAAGDIPAGHDAILRYVSGSTEWQLMNPAGAALVTGPASSTDGHVPKFSGATGKVLADGYTVGTSASNLVQLDSSAKLPAVDGSQLTKLPTTLNANAFTASGSFTFTAPVGTTTNTRYKLTLTGGGGGGGSGGPGGGGGGGETIIKYLTGLSAGTNYSGSVGAGGAAQSAGGDTTITIGATTYTAHGGAAASGASAGAGGSGGNGDINISGGTGGTGNATGSYCGHGGASMWGAGSTGSAPTGAVGSTFGVGGNGGTTTGGAGHTGIALIELVS